MLASHKNFSLKKYNTFGVDVTADDFFNVSTVDELKEVLLVTKDKKSLILGGGSNLLFTSNFNGAVIHPLIQGIEIVEEDNDSVLVKVGAGVEWDSLVEYTVSRNLGGLENLSLIPGSVGASPIQNIGAYGVEVKDHFERVEGILTSDLTTITLNKSECKFGYRDSVFKNKLKGKVVVTYVYYRLSKNHTLVTHYGNLDIELLKFGDKTIQNIRKAVIDIRNLKLPDPLKLPNAGSFFKNPIVSIDLIKGLQQKYEHVPFYPVSESEVKLPAGWLIEQGGWKGREIGNVGVHKNQALVLVNYANATGQEILALAHDIQRSIKETFNVSLEMEVNVV